MKIPFKVLSVLILVLLFCLPVMAAEQVYFYHTDPVGTPLSMTNSSGTVVWKADYKPFGEEQSVTATTPNDRRFVGKEKDEETGLSYFGARYEDARTGRFIAPDPVRAVDSKTSKTNEKMLANPQRLNTFAYALNNPYRYVDPDGRAPIFATDTPYSVQRFSGGGGLGHVAGEAALTRPLMRSGGSSSSNIGYHATYPEAAEAIVKNGFNNGTKPGRLGSNGTYVNSTAEGAIAEFQFHNPGITPKVIEVEYNSGVNASASTPPRSYVNNHPLNVDSISAPSLRAPGTVNTNILNGSVTPLRMLP